MLFILFAAWSVTCAGGHKEVRPALSQALSLTSVELVLPLLIFIIHPEDFCVFISFTDEGFA